jgi:hypothetical protein
MNIYFIYLFLWVYGQHQRKFNRNIVERITYNNFVFLRKSLQETGLKPYISMNKLYSQKPSIYIYERTTTEPLTYLSHQLTDNQRPIDLYVSPIN